jgi:hypothetical protein
MAQNKTVKVEGNAKVEIEGDRLIITPEGGLIAIMIADLAGTIAYMHHPLSGWYIEMDLRKDTEE